MPTSEAPSTLSGKAASTWKSAFNSAWSGTCSDSGDRRDECASRVAWSAVKKTYRKEGDAWVAKEASEPEMKLRETLFATEAEFDDEKQEALITIVKPGISANRRNHKPEAIRRAVENGIWNNSPMFLDHADDRKMPMKRSIKDLVSMIQSTDLGEDGRARGRVKFINREFYNVAKEAKDVIGVSMATQFKGKQWRGHDGLSYEEVDDYVKNISVDWVAFPAAGGAIEKFLSAFESEDNVDWDKLTLDDLKQHAPTIYEEIQTEAREAAGNPPDDDTGNKNTGGDSVPKAEIQQMIATALEDARGSWEEDREKERQSRTQVTEFVNKAGLPPKMRGQVIDDLVEKGSFDEKMAQESVDAAWDVLKDAGLPGPKIVGAGPSGQPKDDTEKLQALEDSAPELLAFESAMGYAPGKGN